MDLIHLAKRAFDVWLRDVLPLVVATLIWLVLTPLTLGILGGPLLAGLFRMVLGRVRDGRTPEIGDVFYFERAGSFIAAFYGLGILIGIGFLLLIVPGLYLSAIWFYVFPLMLERQLGFGAALGESKALVDQHGLGLHFGIAVLLALFFTLIGTLTQMLGSIVGVPYAVVFCVLAYDTLRPQGRLDQAVLPAEPR